MTQVIENNQRRYAPLDTIRNTTRTRFPAVFSARGEADSAPESQPGGSSRDDITVPLLPSVVIAARGKRRESLCFTPATDANPSAGRRDYGWRIWLGISLDAAANHFEHSRAIRASSRCASVAESSMAGATIAASTRCRIKRGEIEVRMVGDQGLEPWASPV